MSARHLSVLRKARRSDIKTDPFPYIVIPDVLETHHYEELQATFPGFAAFTGNKPVADAKYVMRGLDVIEGRIALPKIWQDFVSYHTSKEFFEEFADLFGPEVEAYYPRMLEVLGKSLKDFSTVVRTKGIRPSMESAHDFFLDCQPYIDCTFTPRPMRGTHVDSPEELYAGLLYLRDPKDDSTGGSLEVRRSLDEAAAFPEKGVVKYPDREGFPRDATSLVGSIPYRPNSFVMFINSWRSLHGAETRSPHVLPRRAVNIIGEIARYDRAGLFQVLAPPQKPAPRASWVVRAKAKARRVVLRALS